MPVSQTLDFSEGWQSLAGGQVREQLETRVLPPYLSRQRWFGSKGTQVESAELKSHSVIAGHGGEWLLAIFRAHLVGSRTEDYFVPLAIEWDGQTSGVVPSDSAQTLAGVRKGKQSGTLVEALADGRFIAELVRAVAEERNLTGSDGSLRFSHTTANFPIQPGDEENIKKLGAEQSNSSILIAKKMILKAYRKLEAGVQPELEMGRYLTDVAHYQNTPPLLGWIEQIDSSGQSTALAVIQGFVANQGDGWTYTLNHLKGSFEAVLQGTKRGPGWSEYSPLAERLGMRIAELHRAFALDSGDPAFQPEPISAEDVAAWKRQIHSEAETTFGLLDNSQSALPPEQQSRVRTLLGHRNQILELITGFGLKAGTTLKKTRFHGDLHLGQVLVAGDDFYIIDFEGEPARPFAQRRAKHSPLRDVAGMLRSLNYAAWSALFEAAAGEPEKLAALEESAIQWEETSSKALLRGYRDAVDGCPSCPADPDTFARLCDLFTLEKALYEVRYELANRPSWLRIPVEGIMSLLAHQKGS